MWIYLKHTTTWRFGQKGSEITCRIHSLLIGSNICHAYANKGQDHLLKVHPSENADCLTADSEICTDLGWTFFLICFFFCVWATLWDCSVNHYCIQILNSHHHLLHTYSLPTQLWRHLYGAQSKSFGTCCNLCVHRKHISHSSYHRQSCRQFLQGHRDLTVFSKIKKITFTFHLFLVFLELWCQKPT